MPDTRGGHAASISQPLRPSEMEASRSPRRLLEEPGSQKGEAKRFHTDDAGVGGHHALAEKKHHHQLDKRSMDYILRSGLAGGLAGCAVRDARSHCRTRLT